ncbi:MAG TPA: hypothetical protein VJO36_03605 [Actinomycetota bacterium]|nr:hypothetical protein [Actinomycetota bacterium]
MRVPQGFEAEFDRIESAVDAGNTDLRAMGFWRLLAKVKADAALSAHWAEQAGRIDRKAFEARVRRRFPVWFGNLVLLVEAMAGAFAVGIALGSDEEVVAGLALVFAGVAWSVAFHCPTHWLVGRIVGIGFTAYFLAGPFPPRPGVKTDYASYLRASPVARAWMHGSGAVVTKLAPFIALAFWPATDVPTWAAIALAAIGVFQIVTDVVFSTKRGDWKKVRRELRVARARNASR